MLKKWLRFTFHKRIVVISSIVLIVTTILVGVVGYIIAKSALDNQGKQILKNSVEQAMMLIDAQYKSVENGTVSEVEAQENVKIALMGERNPDGTREMSGKVDIGEHGYFIIYNSNGTEIMHPTMEGENVWSVTDKKDSSRFIVQEQIEQAKAGGGFMSYCWTLPYSDTVKEKLSYARYYENWDWTVVATAYKMDFNSEANRILITMFVLIIILLVLIIYLFNIYINTITDPISKLAQGMEKVKSGEYKTLEKKVTGDEIENLIAGYNSMVNYLEVAENNIKIKNNQISYLAYHDDMTELPNFYGMQEQFGQIISQCNSNGYLILINIIGLNVINGIKGYDQGTQFIREFGKYLLERKPELFGARTSSNEFAIWMEFADSAEGEVNIQQLQNNLKRFATTYGYGQILDFRFAVSLYPVHGNNFDSLYEKATIVMKSMKDSGKSSYRIFEDEMKKEIEDKIALSNALRKAFEEEEIIPFYQEKVNFETMEVVGVEALARWKSKELGMVGPGVFIPAIHQLNMTNEFTRYIIKHTFSDYKKIVEKYQSEIQLSINITPSCFLDDGFYNLVKNAMELYEIPENKLTLEITEDIFISDLQAIKDITDRLHKIGVRISIDDFGTGYSSLNYLSIIDFDEMKIDKSFIDRIVGDEKVFELVTIFCNIANVCGYDIVAEGVETIVQLDRIRETPLKIIQGYLFSKPEPI